MLKGIDPILTPELLMHLCAMGHNEWLAVVDANFTANYLASRATPAIPMVRLAGVGLERACKAVLSVMPLASDVPFAAGYMHASGTAPDHQTAVQLSALRHIGTERVQAIERFAFYERCQGASLIIQSGELSAYGNVLLCKGFVET